MMAEMLVVTVPSGPVMDGLAKLRVLFVPRLQADAPATLADFGLQDWPLLLSRAVFTASTGGDPATSVPLAITAPAARGDSAIWRSFFAPDMPVDPWQARSYPAPEVDETAAKASQINEGYARSAQAYASADPNAAGTVAGQYAPWTADDPAGADSGLTPDSWRQPDFHRIVSMLREHSTVLMELGLIVELSVEARALQAAPIAGPQRLISVTCTLGDDAPAMTFTPAWTRYAYDGAYFLPFAAAEGDIRQGMLDLRSAGIANAATARERTKWVIATFDVDGAVGRLRDAARSGGASADMQDGVSLPVLHSVGPTLIRAGRAEQLHRRAARGARNMRARAQDLVLDADDLILGYRVDIQRLGEGSWRSLCARTAAFTVNGQAIGAAAFEEGHVKANAAAVGTDRVLRANEVVARWSGWSLALPRPLLDENGRVPSDATPVPMPFDFKWDFKAAGSQPSLRFGNYYLMRIRIADMAGGGLPAHADESQYATPAIAYRRHEPIAPPELAPPPDLDPAAAVLTTSGREVNPFGPGGTIDGLVLRSDPAADLDVAAFAAANPGYARNDRRWLMPPSMSFALAEQHGKLDGEDATTWTWAQRSMAVPQAATNGHYNWLPDVAAIGIAAWIRTKLDTNEVQSPNLLGWGDDWPELSAKRLQLGPPEAGRPLMAWSAEGGQPGDGWPADATGTLLTVRLAPAMEIEVELSSYPDSNDLDQHEITGWLGTVPGTAVATGRHPMVTPARVLRFVHAVRKPLNQPGGVLVATRGPGQTTVALTPDPPRSKLGVDTASTGQVDVAASWLDMVDYPAYAYDGLASGAELPGPTLRTDRLSSLRIDRGAAALPALSHELGDTTHRMISYTVTAISRFTAYFDPGPDDAFSQTSAPILTSIPNAACPLPPVILAAVPAYRWESMDAVASGLPVGAIRRRRLSNRVRIELARPWHQSGEGEQLAVILAPAGSEPDDRHSQIFRDPIWRTGLPAATLDPDMFAAISSPAASLMLGSDNSSVPSRPVVAVPFAAAYDHDSGRWHADIVMPGAAQGSYAPFVRLALARYQHNSGSGMELSPAVLTDFVPLPPDRILTIVPSGDGIDVTLEGVAPTGPRPNQLVVVVEETGRSTRATDVTSLRSDMALWTRTAGAVAIGQLAQAVHLPLPAMPQGKSRRLLVREVEAIDLPFEHPIDDRFLSELHQRTVFLDIVPL